MNQLATLFCSNILFFASQISGCLRLKSSIVQFWLLYIMLIVNSKFDHFLRPVAKQVVDQKKHRRLPRKRFTIHWLRDYKTIFMLSLTEHEIYHAYKWPNANNYWHSITYLHDKHNTWEPEGKKASPFYGESSVLLLMQGLCLDGVVRYADWSPTFLEM